MMSQKILKFILLSFVFVILTGIVFFGVSWFSNSVDGMIHFQNVSSASLNDNVQAILQPIFTPNENVVPKRNWDTQDLKLDAIAGISIEIGSGATKVLFNKNEEKKLPIASLTKLMTAMVVLDNYDLSQRVTIDQVAMDQEGEQGVLKLGEVFSVENLLYSTLMESNNRAAFALSEVIGTNKFIGVMNANTKKIGLSNTHFQDVTGLDVNSYSTVEDMASLTQYLFKNYPLFEKIIHTKESNLYLSNGVFHHTMVNTNELLGEYDIIGGKTGFTDQAKGCFMVVQNSKQPGNYIVSIILGSEDRASEMRKLIDWINLAYIWQ